MNKKNIFRTLAIAAFAAVAMTSCDKSKSQVDDKEPAAQTATTATKIAYVEVDSIMSQYKFCKDYSLILQKKGQNIQNATTREQPQPIQMTLQKHSNDLQTLNQRLSGEFQTETEKYNNALRDSIQHYLALYNKDKKYTLILSKAGDNILYADKAHDITNEVIAGLNKAYKQAPAEKAATEKKK